MSHSKKQENLESIVLKGLCPNCYSSHLFYCEFEKNKIFGFKCKECGWKNIYTSNDFMEISASWSNLNSR